MTEERLTDLLCLWAGFNEMVRETAELRGVEGVREVRDNIAKVLQDITGSFTGEQKVRLIEAMGFTPVNRDHTGTCPRFMYGRGGACMCIPPETVWAQPPDVARARKETPEDRRALDEKWTREGTHGRDKDEA